MKKIITLALILTVVLCFFGATKSFAASATSGTCGENVTWTLTSAKKLDGSTYYILKVKGIGAMAESPWVCSDTYYRTKIEQVVIEDGVTDICSNAFNNLDPLTKVTIAESVNSIGSGAFNSCENLERITIKGNVQNIGNRAFSYCTKLKKVTIKEGVSSIGESAFCGCVSLSELTIANSVNNIGSYAFADCTGLTNVEIPENTTELNQYIFDGCTKLENITLSKNVTTIRLGAFRDCSKLKNIVLPDTLLTIESGAFDGCSSISSIVIPDAISSIGKNAFYSCDNLKEITTPFIFTEMPLSVEKLSITNTTNIQENALNGCNNLKEVTLPDNLTTIGKDAFYGCSGLNKVNITDLSKWFNIDFANETSNPLYYAKNLYYNDSLVSILNIPDDITKIKSYALYNCTSLTSVVIPNSVTYIENTAFEKCTSITEMRTPYVFEGIPKSIVNLTVTDATDIPSNALNGYINLQSLILPNALKTINSKAFYGCSSLSAIAIPSKVTAIGADAFYGCNALARVDVSDLSKWCNISFANNTANPLYYAKNLYYNNLLVTNLEIPDDVTSISSYAFYNCSNLKSIKIPSSMASIGSNAFYNCNALSGIYITDLSKWFNIDFANETSNPLYYAKNLYYNDSLVSILNIPDDITKIKSYALYNCTSLTSVVIPNSVTYIENTAFERCTAITEMKTPYTFEGIPKSIVNLTVTDATDIPLNALNGYVNLQNLILPNILTTINSKAFYGCRSLSKITIPSKVTTIGTDAFYGCNALVRVDITDLSKWCNISFANNTANPLYYAQNLYLNNTKITSLTVPENVYEIKNYAFYNCVDLSSIAIPNSVAKVGYNVFYNCNNVTDATIPFAYTGLPKSIEKLTITKADKLQANALSGYTNLCEITLPDNMTSIGYKAFYNCTSLTSITIPIGLKSIDSQAFYGCDNLNAVYINDLSTWCNIDFTDLTANPMHNAGKLYLNNELINKLSIPNDIDNLKAHAFVSNIIEKITIPDNVTTINQNAFSGCTGIKEMIIPFAYTGLPKSIEKLTITKADKLQANALSGYTNLCEITLPDNMTSIEYRAFYNCCSLTSITIPSKLKSVADQAFSGCSNLVSVYVKDLNAWCIIDFSTPTANPLAVAKNLYINNERVIELSIPNTITSINKNAFYNCESITAVTIPNTVTGIGENAFYGCSNLTKVLITDLSAWCKIDFKSQQSNPLYYAKNLCVNGVEVEDLIIPNDVSELKSFVFINCNSTSMDLHNGVTSICDNAFAGWLGEKIIVPDNITYISSSSFENCKNIKEVTAPYIFDGLPKTIEKITITKASGMQSGSLNGYNNIKEISLPDGLETIDAGFLKNCTGLTEIVLPSSIREIHTEAFEGCANLVGVYISDLSAWCNIDFENETANPLYYAKNLYINNKLAESLTISDDVTTIKPYVFKNCSIKEVKIPTTVTTIDSKAFDGCNELIEIETPYVFNGLPTSVEKLIITDATEIQSNALNGYSYLKEIILPDSLVSIGANAFKNCIGLTEIIIPSKVEIIKSDAFKGCTNLTKVHSKALLNWCNIEFENTKSNPLHTAGNLYLNNELLEDLEIPDGISAIKNYAFYGATGLKNLTLSNSIASVGIDAFYGCSGLLMVNIADLLTWCNIDFENQGANPLSYAKNLYINGSIAESIIIPGEIEQIKAYTFSNSNITNITIPKSVKAIDKNAFVECESLVDVTTPYVFNGLPKSVEKLKITKATEIQDNALNGYSNLKEIVLPDSLVSIGANAFKDCSSLTCIIIPNDVTLIGADAFAGCNDITDITTPFVFSNMPLSVSKLNITNTNTLNEGALSGYSNLKDITLPTNLETIGANAFKDCVSLTEIVIPNNVISIGSGALNGCNNLTRISIPFVGASADSVGKEALFGYIFGETAFSGSYAASQVYDTIGSLATFYIPSVLKIIDVTKATKVEYGAFNNCMNISKVRFADGLSTVGRYAFAGCDMLNGVYLPNTTTGIGSYAFDNSVNVTIYAPSGSYVNTYAERCNIPFSSSKGDAFVANKTINENNIVVKAYLPFGVSNNTVYVGSYDKNDMLIQVVEKVNYIDGQDLFLTNHESVKYIKVYLWDSLHNMNPLARAIKLNI